jgi:hypothetical protein
MFCILVLSILCIFVSLLSHLHIGYSLQKPKSLCFHFLTLHAIHIYSRDCDTSKCYRKWKLKFHRNDKFWNMHVMLSL